MDLQLTYEPAEDRLLLRLDLGERVVAFWLTRRVVMLLWPILWESAQRGVAGRAAGDARPWLASLQHDQLRDKQLIEQRPALVPNGPPRLVTILRHGPAENGGHVVGLLDASGDGELLTLDDESVHGFIRLLEAAMASAEWHLDLRKPAAPPLPEGSELRH